MPPRRPHATKSAAPSSGSSLPSSATAPDVSLFSQTLSSSLEQFDKGGEETLRSLILEQLEAIEATPLASLPLTYVIWQLVHSALPEENVVGLFGPVISALGEDVREERREVLGEAFMDTVNVLEEEAEGGQRDKVLSRGLSIVKGLVESGVLPDHIPKLLLQYDHLHKLDLLPPPYSVEQLNGNFRKRQTSMFYKQHKYNLLRESSEGFSGLIVLLTSQDALVQDGSTEPDYVRKQRATRVWAKVMALIGYFNLSPPRVLDLILEIASCHVAAHWRFFLDLLRCSPWGWAADRKGKGKEVSLSWATDDTSGVAEVMEGDGDRVLSQVLGVKFGFCQKPDGEDTPLGLVYVAALLIKHGFISLSDILPFLSPTDEDMGKIKKDFLDSLGLGRGNALSKAGALDDGVAETPNVKGAEDGSVKDEDPTKKADGIADSTKELPPRRLLEQRIQLLQALLAIGDIESSLFFLAKFPWLASTFPPIADLIMRMVAFGIESLYSTATSQQAVYADDVTMHEALKPYVGFPKDAIPTLFFPVPPETATRSFEFFYPDWSEGLAVWSSVGELHDRGLRWLALTRELGGRTVDTMVKICRIGAAHFDELRRAKEESIGLAHGTKVKAELRLVDPTPQEMQPWLHILRLSLLPALSVSGSSAAFDVDLWLLLKHFPYDIRYQLFAEWRDVTCTKFGCPIAASLTAEADKETKRGLQRVTSQQDGGGAVDRNPARALAKLSHANPLAFWSVVINQVKSYPNIGQSIVDACRYMTQLSLDVAAFTLLDTLSKGKEPAAQRDLDQLLNVANFVADLNRRYANVDLEPFLQYILNRLVQNQTFDLIVFDQLLSTMSGVSQIDNDAVSSAQLQALSCGPELIREAYNATVIMIDRPLVGEGLARDPPRAKDKKIGRSLPRLMSALRDTRWAIPMWIALAQADLAAADQGDQEDDANRKDGEGTPETFAKPIKTKAATQDTQHGIFLQYSELLTEHLPPSEHISLIPDLVSLVHEFALGYPVAFQVLRPRLTAQLDKVKAEEKVLRQRKLAEKAEKVKQFPPGGPDSPTIADSSLASPQSASLHLDADGDAEMSESGATVPAPNGLPESKPWWPIALHDTMKQAKTLLSSDVNSILSASFFVIFWQLSLPDIAFEVELYNKQIARINALDKEIGTWRLNNVSAQKGERARLKARLDVLKKEMASQDLHAKSMHLRFERESPRWFGKAIAEKSLQRRLSVQLHQHCFYPRSVFTPSDALFVAKFIRKAHDFGTVGFSTLFAYDNFFGEQLAACIFSLTTNEARNLGRCLAAIFADLNVWHQDEAKYKKEALGEGDGRTSLPGMDFRNKAGSPLRPMNWQQFRNFYAKCHNNLTKALVSCWGDKEFMHGKNAITVALQVMKFFPVMDTNSKAVKKAVADVKASVGGKYNDLALQCEAYLRTLTRQQVDRPPVSPAAFHSAGAPKTASTAAHLGLSDPPRAVNGTAASASQDSSNKPAPTGPRSDPPKAAATDKDGNKPTTGSSTPSKASPASAPKIMVSDKALAQKLESLKAKNAEKGPVPAAPMVKEETKPSPSSPAQTPSAPASTAAPPAGPRATRSTTSSLTAVPSGPAKDSLPISASVISSAASSTASTIPVNAGSSYLPSKPGLMAPPNGTDLEEERKAARARKFGALTAPSPPTGPAISTASPAQSPSPLTVSVKAEPKSATESGKPANPRSPISVRRASPPLPSARSTHRSGSVDSKASERSRLGRAREDRSAPRENGTRSRESSERKPDDAVERKRHEGLLKQREDELKRGYERRPSRDERRRETEKERDERKAKEKERAREKERDKRADDDGHKRKRDEEPPRRIDDPRDRDRDRREERRDRERGDRRDTRDDRDQRSDRREDRRDDRRRDDPLGGRDGDRRRRERDTHDRSPPREMRQRSPDKRDTRSIRDETANGERTPKRDQASKELLPSRPNNGLGDRIIEAPRLSRFSDAPSSQHNEPISGAMNGNRTAHALPQRPDPSRPSPDNLGGRLGPARSPIRSPTRLSNPSPVSSRAEPARPTPAHPGSGDPAGASNPKRPRADDNATREESPGEMKRVKLNRSGVKPSDGSQRMLESAMKGSK